MFRDSVRLNTQKKKIKKCSNVNCTRDLENWISTDSERPQFVSRKMSDWWIVAFLLVIDVLVSICVGSSEGDLRRIGRRQKGFTFYDLTITAQQNWWKINEKKNPFTSGLRVVYLKVTPFYSKHHCAATQRWNWPAFWMFRMNMWPPNLWRASTIKQMWVFLCSLLTNNN